MFFDHISSGDSTQDCIAVCSMLDAIFSRLKTELPRVRFVCLISDNARCYQNDLVQVISPFLANAHSLHFKSVVHAEMQRGKSLLDAHSALALKRMVSWPNLGGLMKSYIAIGRETE